MQTPAPDNALALDWLSWWQYGFWLQADTCWRTQRLAQLPAATQIAYLRQHAQGWHQTLGIMPAPLPPPQPLVLAISALDTEARARLLALVAEICGGATGLPAELKIWLRRVARGMRTECWLPDGLFATDDCGDSARLLQALYPSLWPRLRLLFPQAETPQGDVLSLPAHRLRPLWEAALWQVQQTPGNTPDVETENP